MRIRVSTLIMAFTLMRAALPSFADERATATGKVVDAAGKPVENATVIVHSAGLKKGYSIFCPTCYTDCGKRAVTDPQGNFAISGLNPDLTFTLLAVKEGYSSEYTDNIDPAAGPAVIGRLKPRPAIGDVSQIVRGRVVDPQGKPQRDVLVEPQAVMFNNPTPTGTYGRSGWIDSAAVTNDRGEFEMAFGKPAELATVMVTARGMAPKIVTAPTGGDRKAITVTDGAMIRGRLVYHGKPVSGAELGLVLHQNVAGYWYPEVRIGTREDGTFAITNVPTGRIWSLYPKMASLASRDIGGDAIICETKSDGQEIDLGDIQLKPTHTLRGKVLLGDGRPIPPHMHVTLTPDRAWDNQVVQIDSDGRFEFRGLPDGIYTLAPGVSGYRLPDQCPFCSAVELLVNTDMNDFVIRMEPRPEVARPK
jgi:hypothetical protein